MAKNNTAINLVELFFAKFVAEKVKYVHVFSGEQQTVTSGLIIALMST